MSDTNDVKIEYTNVDTLCLCSKRACCITVSSMDNKLLDAITVCGEYSSLVEPSTDLGSAAVCMYHSHSSMQPTDCYAYESWMCHMGELSDFSGLTSPFPLSCDCCPAKQAAMRKVKKEGVNKGRLFFCCPAPMNSSCKFFRFYEVARVNEKKGLPVLMDCCSVFTLKNSQCNVAAAGRSPEQLTGVKRETSQLSAADTSDSKVRKLARDHERVKSNMEMLEKQVAHKDLEIAELRATISYYQAIHHPKKFV